MKGFKHGLFGTLIYSSWMNMRMRCSNRKHGSYPNYGGRGITVCLFLNQSPANLKHLIGEPGLGKSLNRINNDGNYSCGTCQECCQNGWKLNVEWATKQTQSRNTRRNRILYLQGEGRCEIEWAEILGINVRTIIARLAHGMTDAQALSKTRVKRSFLEARMSQIK